MRYRDVPRAEGFDGRSVQGSRERERNSLAPPTLDIYLSLSNLSLYDAARDLRTSRPLKFPNLIVSLTRFVTFPRGREAPYSRVATAPDV